MNDPTDNLTPLARRVLKLDAGQAYEKLVIGHVSGNPHALPDLTALAPDGRDLCAKFVTDTDESKSLLAGLWLWHDYLDESHEICQAIETPSGSLWHAILHRREGDFSNAKYWYRRVGEHPALQAVVSNATVLLRDQPADKALLRLTTSPESFGPALVDLVQAIHNNPTDPRRPIAIALQQLEFRILFESNASAAQR